MATSAMPRTTDSRTSYTGPGMIATGEATALLPTETTPPIRVFGTESIAEALDDLVLNPDAHRG